MMKLRWATALRSIKNSPKDGIAMGSDGFQTVLSVPLLWALIMCLSI